MTIAAGAPILADDLDDALEAVVAVTVARTANATPKVSNTTLGADSVLLVPAAVNRLYRVEAFILYTSDTLADFKFDFVGPAGSTHYYNAVTLQRSLGTGGTTPLDTRYGEDGLAVATPGGGLTFATQRVQTHVVGTLTTGGTAGDLTFRWAQNTSQATSTTVHAGSWMRLEPMD